MKKYTTPIVEPNAPCCGGEQEVYLASEVDAYRAVWLREHEEKDARIVELEKALRKIATDDDGNGLTYIEMLHVAGDALEN